LLGDLEVASGSFAALHHHVVGYLLSFIEVPQACRLYGSDVHEDVLAPFLGLDEAIPLLLVEPFHRPSSHPPLPISVPRMEDHHCCISSPGVNDSSIGVVLPHRPTLGLSPSFGMDFLLLLFSALLNLDASRTYFVLGCVPPVQVGRLP